MAKKAIDLLLTERLVNTTYPSISPKNWLHFVVNTAFCWPHLAMDTTHYVLSAHAHNLAHDIGKGRQLAACIIELFDHRYAPTSTLQRVRGMCSIEL